MSRAGQGALFEQFLKLKAAGGRGPVRAGPQAAPAADAARHRPGDVAGRGRAARCGDRAAPARAPHVPVVLAPAAVQGAAGAGELAQALSNLYQLAQAGSGLAADPAHVDVILLVRGGGSMEDLWAFNDEPGAHHRAQPGAAGLRRGPRNRLHHRRFLSPTCVPPRPRRRPNWWPRRATCGWAHWACWPDGCATVLSASSMHSQRLDQAAGRLGRPSALLAASSCAWSHHAQRLRYGVRNTMEHTLPPLPYAIDALAPHYSKETLEFHHGKHHNAYVVNLNNLQKGTEFESCRSRTSSRSPAAASTTTRPRSGTTPSSGTA
jgi:exodeoxyribonuclease VII large subunit